jgi:TetR/AcrR family acrAB operon transcriptional repressor
MARRTKEEAQATRNRILDTAERVFLKKGVSHTSLDDLAEAAGVTRGAIYWHFKNKVDLFEAMTDRVCLPMEETVSGSGDDDPLVYVRRCALTVLGRLTSDAQCHRVFEICCSKVEYVNEMKPLRARHARCRDEWLDDLESAFRRARQRGLIAKSANPRLAAVGLHALVDGLIMNWVLDPKYLSLAKQAAPLIDGYLGGLKVGASKTSG